MHRFEAEVIAIRAEAHLRRFTLEQPAEVLLVLAQVGALAVGGFQLDVNSPTMACHII